MEQQSDSRDGNEKRSLGALPTKDKASIFFISFSLLVFINTVNLASFVQFSFKVPSKDGK